MSEAKYPIRDSKVIEAQKRAFDAKIEKNRRAGIDTFARGHVDGFAGYSSERMGGEYEFKLEFSLATQKEILERTVEPLKVISQKHGIQQFYPYDGELPPHVTLEVARFTNLEPGKKAVFLQKLNGDLHLAMISKILRGLDFSFDSVVTSGRDTYICVGEFNANMEPIYRTRKIIERVMARTIEPNSEGTNSGLVPVNYQDILHSTIGRIDKSPDNPDQLLAYAIDIEKEIGNPLQKNPINVQIDNVYYGSALAYHVAHASPQLKK